MKQWDSANIETAFTPTNRRGHNPVYSAEPARRAFGSRQDALHGDPQKGLPEDSGAGSANFSLSIPVVRLPGRGLDLALNLHYNSRVWHLTGQEIIFDIDAGWPFPGWSLGFGSMEQVSAGDYMLVGSDGTRHPYTKAFTQIGGVNYYMFRTTDGTFIDYSFEVKQLGQQFLRATARYPDGTVVEYGAGDLWRVFPTRITDANGNYITITYRNNIGPRLDSITDTLGRKVNFHYDSKNYLTAITGPGLNGSTRTFVRLASASRLLDYAFDPSLAMIGPSPDQNNKWTRQLDTIYYPATSIGYAFYYSGYGMASTVDERRGMTFSGAPLTDQGTFTTGKLTRRRSYNYPHEPDPTLKDAPRYTTMTETWDGMDTAPAVTSYSIHQEDNPRKLEVTYPDGTRTVQLSYNKPGQYDDGLVYQLETFDAANKLLRKKAVTWEKGDRNTPRITRVEETGELGQMKPVEYIYGPSHNQVTEMREYDYGGHSVKRKTRTEYETNPAYTNRHIFNLPTVVEVYQYLVGWLPNLESRVEYAYDGASLVDTPGVVQHRDVYNPYLPNYDPANNYRGNLTRVTQYTDAVTRWGALNELRSYDITGNVVKLASIDCCEEIATTYTPATQYAYPTSVTRGAAGPGSPARVTTSATYDFNTGLVLSKTDASGGTTKVKYDPTSLRVQTKTWSTGAKTGFSYDDPALKVTETTCDSSGRRVDQVITQFNGLGQHRRVETLAEGGTWDIEETKYDALGRLWQQSRPYRTGETPRWSETAYDGLGRVTLQRAPDGSKTRIFYNEPTRPPGAYPVPGETVRVQDAWGRDRWGYFNELGQLTGVYEPDPAGSGSVLAPNPIRTAYQYNARGQLLTVIQGPSPGQARTFRYDSLGRLTHQRLPERDATLHTGGAYGGPGVPGASWSDAFTYDARSNLISATDARGVKTVFNYGNDPLNRLQSVSYDTSGFGDTQNPIQPAPDVSFEYETTGDVTRVRRVTTVGISTEEYGYDPIGRVNSKTLTLAQRPSFPFTIGYLYDSLNRLWRIRYPAQYGLPNSPRKVVQQDYGMANRPKVLTRDGGTYASELEYDAAGQITAMKVGPVGTRQISEHYDYDPWSGLLDRQRVRRGGTSLLDLSYLYNQWWGTSGSATGQLTQITDHLDPSRGRMYEYDALGRLVKAMGGDSSSWDFPWTQTYTYDLFGNRTGATATGNTASDPAQPIPSDGAASLAYNTKTNRITTPGYSYDAAGNLTRAQRADGAWQRLQYDAAGRLVKVMDDAGRPVETYQYGPNRQRLIARTLDSSIATTTIFVWSGDSVLTTYSDRAFLIPRRSSPSWSRSYVYLGDRLLATLARRSDGEVVRYHHPDRLGTRLITTGGGEVSEQVHLPFGTALDAESTSSNNPYFTSYDRSSATRLDYAVNRFYDAHQGRFTQVDPLGMGAAAPTNPQSFNMYAYVRNDPVNMVDPLGLFESEENCIVDENGTKHCFPPGVLIGDEITVTGLAPNSDTEVGGWVPIPSGGAGSAGREVDAAIDKRLGEVLQDAIERTESLNEALAEQFRRIQCRRQHGKQVRAQFEADVRQFREQMREATWRADRYMRLIPGLKSATETPRAWIELGLYEFAPEFVRWNNFRRNFQLAVRPPCD